MSERSLWFIGLMALLCLCGLPLLRGDITPQPDPRFTDTVPCPPRGLCVDGSVVRVVDGDTIDVETRIVYRVRLLDCWAPESRTRDLAEKQKGLESTRRLTELSADQPVRVFVPGSGNLGDLLTFDRVLGRVWVLDNNGQPAATDLSSIMVREGKALSQKPLRDAQPGGSDEQPK